MKIVEGAANFLFGKILSRNYRGDYLSFYDRDNNNCELLDKKASELFLTMNYILPFTRESIYINIVIFC